METLLQFQNVNKIYKMDSVKVHAIADFSIKIDKKELIAIIGPSGSGKSTLLNLIGFLDKPTSGKVLFEGKDVSNLNEFMLAKIRRDKIGFVFQTFNLYPTLNALENVELPMVLKEVDKKTRYKKALELLEIVGLEHRTNSLPSQLSGGERQRVAIARALANNPQIILADEPTGNLDTKSGEEIINLLVKLNKELGTTVIIVTHDSGIASIADRIIFIRDGKLVGEKRRAQ